MGAASAGRRKSKFPLALKRPHACSTPCGKAKPAPSPHSPRLMSSGTGSFTAGRVRRSGRDHSEVKSAIAEVSAFAPLHNRAELEGIEIIEKLLGAVRPGCGFRHRISQEMPLSAAAYPGPYEWLAAGIRRYGFHGINHKYCARRAAQLLRRDPKSFKLVTCHLGNGCSLAAIRDGRSVDTTMGFTPLEGLMMGTRSGSVDPGILTYLMRQSHLTASSSMSF